MNVLVITKNSDLQAAIAASLNQNDIVVDFQNEYSPIHGDLPVVLVADSDVVKSEELAGITMGAYERVIYLTKTELESAIPCVVVLPYDGRPTTAADKLVSLLVGSATLKNVFAYWSPVSGSGVTMISLTAFQKLPDTYRALYLSLTDVPGVEYKTGGIDAYLSNILPRLCSRVIQAPELADSCTKVGNKYYLGGLMSIVDNPRYTVDDIKALLSMASMYFDYVFLDAGHGATLMGIAALTAAAKTYVVITPSLNALVRYDQILRQCYSTLPDYDPKRLKLVLNKEDKEAGFTNRNRLSGQYEKELVGTLRVVEPATALRAEYTNELLYDLDAGSGYRTDMEALLSIIYSDAGITGLESRRKGWFSRFMPAKGGR